VMGPTQVPSWTLGLRSSNPVDSTKIRTDHCIQRAMSRFSFGDNGLRCFASESGKFKTHAGFEFAHGLTAVTRAVTSR
jgi:hypothetical protein